MIPLMALDETERIPKWRFYSSNRVMEDSEEDTRTSADVPSFVKIPKKAHLRRTVSLPTSFKERKKHLQTHRRSKTTTSHSKPSPFRSLSNVSTPEGKRKLPALESRYPERHDSQRWVYARRDEYNRYLIPRTESTESITTVYKGKAAEQDDVGLLGLAFVDEVAD